jgi:TPR repeat protein
MEMTRYRLLFLLVLLVGAAQVLATTIEMGQEAVARKDYVSAVSIFKPLVESGDARASYELGLLYEEGLGVPKDPTVAVTMFKQAADQNLPEGLFSLGRMYGVGKGGIPIDHKEAFKLYLRAAELNYSPAQVFVGLSYQIGAGGVGKSMEDAYKWYLRAAHLNNSIAQVHIARMYLEGNPRPRSFLNAHVWYDLAARNKQVMGEKGLEIVKKNMTPQEIELATKEADNCVKNLQSCK